MERIMKSKRCKHCGYDNPMENCYCAKCGTVFRNMVPVIEKKYEEAGEKKKSSRLPILVTVVVGIILLLTIILLTKTEPEQTEVPCAHNWVFVDCVSPRICSECGKTGGDAAGHNWQEATCEKPKICAVCDITEGMPKDHTWEDATCKKPKTCAECDATEGVPEDHTWENATCERPMQCKVCGEVSGAALGHDWQDATFLVAKTCLRCNLSEGSPLSYAHIHVETEVERIRAVYNDIQNAKENGILSREYIVDGVVGYFDASGTVRCIEVHQGIDGIGQESSKYIRSYYYDGDELIFAFYEGKDSHRLYFYNGLLMRWLYRSNGVSEYHDFDFTSRYLELEVLAQAESRLYQ
jgi:hypothetical protein